MADSSLPALFSRINRKLEIGRGMHLDINDLRLLVHSGALRAMAEAVTLEQETKWQETTKSKGAARPERRRFSTNAPRLS